ncbi:hypothetical protein VNO80_26609 [Phaseolus coccineus]|uniref:Uncharacterized protein n=1 Tax=Phaseolus coccineus TaxID=3886 RepID=A0AAN9LIS8_PHACN
MGPNPPLDLQRGRTVNSPDSQRSRNLRTVVVVSRPSSAISSTSTLSSGLLPACNNPPLSPTTKKGGANKGDVAPGDVVCVAPGDVVDAPGDVVDVLDDVVDVAPGDVVDVTPGDVLDVAPSDLLDVPPGDLLDIAPGDLLDLAPGHGVLTKKKFCYDPPDISVASSFPTSIVSPGFARLSSSISPFPTSISLLTYSTGSRVDGYLRVKTVTPLFHHHVVEAHKTQQIWDNSSKDCFGRESKLFPGAWKSYSVQRRYGVIRLARRLLRWLSQGEEVCFPDLVLKRLFGKWNGACTEVDTEAGSEDGGAGGVMLDSVGSDFGEDDGVGVGEEATVQCQVASPLLGMARLTSEVEEFQKNLGDAIKGNGFYEEIPSQLPGFNEGLSKNVLANYDGAAHAQVAWPVDECHNMGVNEEQIYTKKNLNFNIEVGEAAEVGFDVACDLLSLNKESSSHQLGIKEEHAKSHPKVNKETTSVDMEEKVEASFVGLTLAHAGGTSWVGDSLGSGPTFDELEHSGVRLEGKGGDHRRKSEPRAEKLDRVNGARREDALEIAEDEQGDAPLQLGVAMTVYVGAREGRLIEDEESNGGDLLVLEGKELLL